MLQLHKTDDGTEYGEFLHLPKKRFTDYGNFLTGLSFVSSMECMCFISLLVLGL